MYICNQFALPLIIFDKEFRMETPVEEIEIDESTIRPIHTAVFTFTHGLLHLSTSKTDFRSPASVRVPHADYGFSAHAHHRGTARRPH
uniref:Uncharacterized protein n=1 Tax=Romanomermis culicivorax TaxID=13658 RepID=A0A915KRB0_ROMCU